MSQTLTINSAWVKDSLSGGYNSANNPQILFIPSVTGQANITVKKQGNDGLIFFIYQAQDRFFSTTGMKPVAQSPYYSSDSVSLSVTLQQNVSYVILCCLATQNQDLAMTMTVEGGIAQLRVLPPPCRKFVDSQWKGDTAAGYGSTANPQLQLFVSRKSTFGIECKRINYSGASCGMRFQIVKGVLQPNKKKRQVAPEEIFHESPYFNSNSVRSEVDLPASNVPYIIIPFLQNKGQEGQFRISIDCANSDFKLEEIKEVASASNPTLQANCADILAKYRSSKSNKNYLFEKNPVPEIIEYCRKNNAVFVDSDFPANKQSLDNDPRKSTKSNEISSIVSQWKRPSDITDAPQLFINGISINDLRQGAVGDCWLCEAIASTAERPELIQRLFYPQTYNEYGVYSVRLYDPETSAFYYIVLDDQLAISKGTNQIAFARSTEEGELWPSLIEKAFAKYFGGYAAIEGRYPGIALECLTGGATEMIMTHKASKDEVWKKIRQYDAKGWIMGCSTDGTSDRNINSLGIVGNHAYSLIQTHEFNGLKLCYVRNTWGHSEWKGDWSDQSPLWTEQMKQAVNFQKKDDGCFYIALDDFVKQFSYAYLCKIVQEEYPFIYKSSGKWTQQMSQGYMQHSNPRFRFVLKGDHPSISVTLKWVGGANPQGIILSVCQGLSKVPRGSYVWDTNVLAKSQYLCSSEVSMELATLQPDTEYYLLACSCKTGIDADISIIFRSNVDVELEGAVRDQGF